MQRTGGVGDVNRVLFIGEYGARNGGENSWLAILPTLVDAGLTFVALVPSPSKFATALNEAGAQIIDLNLKDPSGIRKSQSQIRQELDGAIQRLQPTLVHANSLATSRLIGPVASAAGISSVGYIRDIIKLSKKAIEDLNHIDCLIAVSHATRDFHVGQGIDANRICVNYNGTSVKANTTETKHFDAASIRRELAISEQDRLICSIGQIGMRKGLETTIAAFLLLAEQYPEIHLLLIGQRHSQKDEAIAYEKNLHQLTSHSPHSNRIHWLGRREDALAILTQSELLLHSARQEPLGRVLLESAGLGIPFIATDVGGTIEIAGNDLCSDLVVPVDSPKEMAAKASLLLADNGVWKSVSMRLQAIAGDVFSIAGCAERLLAIYRNLGVDIPQKTDIHSER